jgi:exodeoxyribonuclease V alpha subunit
MYYLITALSVRSSLILVGDVFQLPSVGPGNVLSDLIESGRIHYSRLNEIFRQDEEGWIVRGAHRIREGQFPEFDAGTVENGDFVFLEHDAPQQVLETVVRLCSKDIPSNYGYHPLSQIQVLTPMHRGLVGTINLNRQLQRVLNPVSGKPPSTEIPFRPGDKVMHLKNNYKKEVFNGDIGLAESIDPDSGHLNVRFNGRLVQYDIDEMGELSLAYAISVHKSQGSEYPVVVIPVVTQHYPMLQRNLLYTGVTRAQNLVVLVGSRKAVQIALQNDRPSHRRTGLKEMMQ